MRPLKRVVALVLCALALVACSPLGFVNGLTPTDTYVGSTDIAYGADPRERLDV